MLRKKKADYLQLFSNFMVDFCNSQGKYVNNLKNYTIFFLNTIFSLIVPPGNYILNVQKIFGKSSFLQQKNLFQVNHGGELLECGIVRMGGINKENTVYTKTACYSISKITQTTRNTWCYTRPM
eukprot:TRINITY_DN11331_c0_g1_i12.p1 TRINITY_DN11331_c0_g1~~TRINITY_DN11331_c0_g1_i12.p1  ORF type:complete len:124 (+),score=0.72 TRINITY_DN11331_c0_g1_i12:112-483(+)